MLFLSPGGLAVLKYGDLEAVAGASVATSRAHCSVLHGAMQTRDQHTSPANKYGDCKAVQLIRFQTL